MIQPPAYQPAAYQSTAYQSTAYQPAPSQSPASRVPAALAGLPRNVWVQPELHDPVARLLRGSRTFRQQVDVIARHLRYHIAVVIEPAATMPRGARAQCTMRVFSSGVIIARVSLPEGATDAPELVSHEFEHIIEHMEGIDVRARAHAGRVGYFEVGDGRIETARAIRIGRQALTEVQAPVQLTQRKALEGLRAALTHN